jgi:hypothetical protein
MMMMMMMIMGPECKRKPVYEENVMKPTKYCLQMGWRKEG